MRMRELGRSGLKVSAVGLGCMGMSWSYGDSNEKQCVAVIQRAIDLGVNFFDTAELYANGGNEQLLGKAIKGRRDKIIVATKFGLRLDDKGAVLPANGKPAYLLAACDASLKNLAIDYIDLYYQHRVDPTVPIEDTVGAMAELVTAGKVRALGLSEAGAATIRRASKIHPIAALQSEYSLWTRDPEGLILETCRELGVGFVAYSPVSRGLLAGSVATAADIKAPNDKRGAMPRFHDENLAKNAALVERLSAFARGRAGTVAQVALAWLLARGPDIVPIPGTRRIGRLEENLKAADLDLSPADLAELDRICPPSAVAGARYPERGLAAVNL
ncbi:MAG: aldo/keto reductase [Alphaproteobacteria bacterium]|nr:aldo/keto reductase [Alphaproteobacteria bacterium]